MGWEGYAWIAWIVAFGVLETIGLLKSGHSGMTLTFFIETYVPKPIIAAFIGWMSYHFLIAPKAKG